MKELLDRLVPRILPGMERDVHFLCVPHQGRTDLERSIPRKLRGWKEPGVRFVVVEDNDNRDCVSLKVKLQGLAIESGHPNTLVRIVCQELESWYLGDLKATAEAFGAPELLSPAARKRFALPDQCKKPAEELERIVPAFQKGSAARQMGEILGVNTNSSHSFNIFLSGITRIAHDLGYAAS